ncbi:MICOS complex subunit mic19 [Daldinia childiae]|uniref:MICOS complex subunit mic19 n=1 Tax=Daldinia childiae TaxID=326645 RepID=UPI001445D80E|nr:MICOS complex subunit mic19 [Daldinia childiae]KAF3055253.1 MICOS complex subunit mic19 [Daldinia childiae]
MGSSSSKPEASQSSHVWKASSPIGISHDVVETLQSSSETDTTRAQTLELAVQARVASELKKLEAQETAALKAAQDKIAELADSGASEDDKQLNRQAVSKEVEALRARLDKRKQLRPLPDTVEQARGNVVRCLLENDRRPLDCWREVEAFKEEVRRLEKGWVDKVVS